MEHKVNKSIYHLVIIGVLLPMSIIFAQAKKDVVVILSDPNKNNNEYESIFYPYRKMEMMSTAKEQLLLKLHSEAVRKKLLELKKLSKGKYNEMLWALPVPIPKNETEEEEKLLDRVIVYNGHEYPERKMANLLKLDIEIYSLKYQAATGDDKAKIKNELTSRLSEFFNQRVLKMEESAKETQKKMNSLNEQINTIKRNKEQIVNKRLEELIGSAKK